MKKKSFDCVAMKDEIQRRLLADWQGMDDVQLMRSIRKNLRESNSSLGAWWRQAGVEHNANSRPMPAAIH